MRYAPAARLLRCRALLEGAGATIYDLADQLGVCTRTVARYIDALQAAGDPVVDELRVDDQRKVWRLVTSAAAEVRP